MVIGPSDTTTTTAHEHEYDYELKYKCRMCGFIDHAVALGLTSIATT